MASKRKNKKKNSGARQPDERNQAAAPKTGRAIPGEAATGTEQALSEEAAPETEQVLSEETVLETAQAISGEAAPETVQAPSGDAVPETKQTLSEGTVPETVQTVFGDAVPETEQALSEETVPETAQAFSEESSPEAGQEILREAAPAAERVGEEQAESSAEEPDDFVLPEEPEDLPFVLPAVPKQLSDGKGTPPDAGKKKKKRKKRRRKRHILFWLFMFLTLCVAGGSVSYIYWLFTEAHSVIFDMKADVELPNLVGLRWEDVEKDAAYNGFKLQMVEVYHDEAPAGQIVDQNPRAPRDVKENSIITAKVSKGVETVIVPDLAGWNKDTAREKLRGMNLTLMIRPEDNTEVPADSVIRTSPEAGTLVKAGTTITLYIRREATEVEYASVPTCIGAESSQQAAIRLTQRGLLMRVTSEENEAPEGTVIAQSPNPGAMVPTGTVVSLVISTGPPPPPPPPVEIIEPEPEVPDASSDPSSEPPWWAPPTIGDEGGSSSDATVPPDPSTQPTDPVPPPTSDPVQDPVPPPDPSLPADPVQDPSAVSPDSNAAAQP